jgi:hypothetical protein
MTEGKQDYGLEPVASAPILRPFRRFAGVSILGSFSCPNRALRGNDWGAFFRCGSVKVQHVKSVSRPAEISLRLKFAANTFAKFDQHVQRQKYRTATNFKRVQIKLFIL